MVEFARQERLKNKTQETIIKEAIQAKGNIPDSVLNTDKCDGLGGQTRPEYYPELFNRFERSKTDSDEGPLLTEDIKTGFLIFSAIIYCPKSAKQTFQMYQFLNNLVNTESPRTIIQAVVNTIQSETIHEVDDRRRINEFYSAMDKHFGFKYGEILLALLHY